MVTRHSNACVAMFSVNVPSAISRTRFVALHAYAYLEVIPLLLAVSVKRYSNLHLSTRGRRRPMRSGSLFYLMVSLLVLDAMPLTGFPAQALEMSQAGSGAAGTALDGTRPNPADWHWRLTGTVVGPGLREAVFAQGGETRVVEEGREIDGWKLSAVEAGKAMLTCAGETRTATVDGLDDVASGRAALPSAAAARAANAAASNARSQRSRPTRRRPRIFCIRRPRRWSTRRGGPIRTESDAPRHRHRQAVIMGDQHFQKGPQT